MFSSLFRTFSKGSNPEERPKLELSDVDPEQHSEIANLQGTREKTEGIEIQPFKHPYLLSAQTYALLAIFLLLLTAGLGIWAWVRLGSLEKIRRAENREHETMLDSLTSVKANLERNLDTLELAFTNMSVANDTLAERLNNATNIISEKETAIREIQAQNAREEKALRAQVQRLQTIKDRYETLVAVLNNKNAKLLAENADLRGTTDSLAWQTGELARQLESQIRQTMSAQYKATTFRVEVERKNDKLTVRARRSREIKVSFELNNVPPSYQGDQQLYMVITDGEGIPVPSKNPVFANINTSRGNVEIIAQQTRMQNIGANQRLELSYNVEDRLKSGTYVVAVYSEKGLLGVASFRLR